jgi:hypothetical protein
MSHHSGQSCLAQRQTSSQCAEAAAGNRHPRAAGVGARVLEDLVHDHVLVGDAGADAVGGMDAVVVPALGVDTVGTVELDPAGIDQRRGRLDQPEVLVLVVPRLRGWKQDHRPARVPENQHLERPPSQVGSVPAYVLFLHSRSRPAALGDTRSRLPRKVGQRVAQAGSGGRLRAGSGGLGGSGGAGRFGAVRAVRGGGQVVGRFVV